MATKKTTKSFSIVGNWKINSVEQNLNYAFPETIVFKPKNLYSIAGKEATYHPILDGGWYEFNAEKKELKINTANDAIRKYTIKETGNSIVLIENDRPLVKYVKEIVE